MFGYIIVNQSIGHNQYKIKRFIEEFKRENVEVEVVVNNGLISYIKDGEITAVFKQCDFIIYLDKDIYLARLLEKAGYRLFNKADFIKMCDDKMLTFIRCANLGIKMPDTFAGPLVYTSNKEPNLSFLDIIIDKLSLPMVVKRVYGSLGEGVFLAKTKEQLIRLYKDICHSPILFQKYIPSKDNSSIRVLVINGEVYGAFKRFNHQDFRSNFGQTADGKKLENEEKYLDFARNITKKLEIEYAGLDLLEDENGQLFLCEINSNAFFEEFEKVTGKNVASHYVKMILNKVNSHE